MHILYRRSLSRAFSSRWLQIAVELLKQNVFQQADRLQTGGLILCSSVVTVLSVFYFSCAVADKETSIVSHPFGKLSQHLQKKTSSGGCCVQVACSNPPIPWALPAQATLVPPDQVPGQHVQADAPGVSGVPHLSHRHQGSISSRSFGWKAPPPG